MSLQLHAVAEVQAPPATAGPTPHAELVDRLVARVPPAALDPDLALLAYSAPDAFPFKCVATHLNYRTGGHAHSVALTGQGLGAPFTALLVAAAYERIGQSTRSLIVTVESAQPGSAQPESAKPGSAQPGSAKPGSAQPGSAESGAVGLDSGVLLACGAADGPWTVADVTAFGTPGELAAALGRLPAGTLYVLGARVPAPDGRADVHRAEAGSYCTGVWLALARHWDAWRRSRPVLALCDTDAMTGASHLAVLRQARM